MLWTEDGEQFNKSHPGCMAGMFQALDYQYFRKILPHRKHDSLVKNPKRNRRYNKRIDDEDPFEVLKLLDRETSHILVDGSNKKRSSTNKRSLKARIKALVSEGDNLKNDNQKEEFVSSPRLHRTYSIHHLETNEWVHPIIFFPESLNESSVNSKRHSNVTIPEANESPDILEILEVDKELFVNISQPKLTKSGSFPTAYKSGSRNLKPTKLEDKMKEFYTKSKSEKRWDAPLDKRSGRNSDDDSFMRIRRVASLNESADRYAQLVDFRASKEATLRSSRSLKLANASDSFSAAQEPSFLKRNHSYHESHEPYIVNDRNPVSLSLQNHKNADLNPTEEDCDEVSYSGDGMDTVNSPELGQDTSESTIVENNIQSDFQISQELDGEKHVESSPKVYQYEDDFGYVKQILERSGFTKNGFQQTWYSSYQPLDPLVFQEIESQYVHDPERFAEDFDELSHRLLVFELVDDVLVNMYEKSLTYYLKELSPFCHIRPTPSGALIVDQVWKRVSRLINLKADINDSLNYIVAHDLGSDDGWMNLQLDSECVGLDLEDLILDELLEQVLA